MAKEEDKQEISMKQVQAGLLLSLFIDPEDGNMFLRNINWYSVD